MVNAPSHFQKTVTAIVDRGDVSVVIYIDDIVLFGTNPKQVWAETLLVLQRLISAGFKINTKKSHFLVSSLKMLGYNVKEGAISPIYTHL